MVNNSNNNFYNALFAQQHLADAVPANSEITGWAERLICVLYPQLSICVVRSEEAIQQVFEQLEERLVNILVTTTACDDCDNEALAKKFMGEVPEIFRMLNTDIEAMLQGDPAAQSKFEVIRAYPGFYALSFYRVAHAMHRLEIPLIPRILTEQAHSKTGIDIHPGAEIGAYCCIDHGTGIVIGETTSIGRHVKLYQGVTLGALSVAKSLAKIKRHPTVEDHVVIYAGATILGGETIIGHNSVIGGNVWLTKSIPPGSLVYHEPVVTVVEGKYLNTAT